MYVAPISFGLGDLVVSLPIVQALIADGVGKGEETWLVARSASQARLSERIPGLAGCVDEETFHPVSDADRVVDLRDHPLQRDYWWGSPEFEAAVGPLDINQILERIADDFGIDADFSAPAPLRSSPEPGLDSTVLLGTETDGPAKAWPATRWESPIGAAAAAALRRPAGDPGGSKRGPRSPRRPCVAAPEPRGGSPTPSSCRGVTGIDTGLTHRRRAAGNADRHHLTLPHGSVYFPSWPRHARALRGATGDAAAWV